MLSRNHLLLTVALSGGLAISAFAQTGRIALTSHAGRGAQVGDNFGIVPMPADEWRADTLVYVNDSLALHSGQLRSWRYAQQREKAVWHRQVEQEQYRIFENLAPQAVLDELKRQYPNTVFIGFDKWGKHLKRKSLKGTHLSPKRPFQYSYWRALTGVVALGAVGWLLGRKPEAKVG